MQVTPHGDQYYSNHLKLVPFDELLYYVLTPMVIAYVFIYTVPSDFECFVPLALLFKVGTALSHVMDVNYYNVSGYNENYCKASGLVKTFLFDACVLCLTCYIGFFRHKLNQRNDPMTYKNVPGHHLALMFIFLFSILHAFFSQDELTANRINQKEAMQTIFNFYKSNTCIAFGKKHESEQFNTMDKVLSVGPTVFLIVSVVLILINNRNLLKPENKDDFEPESLKPYILRHNILILIILSDLIFDSIFNIWIDFLGTKFMSTRTIGRLCQFILLIQIFLLLGTYRFNYSYEIQGIQLLNKENEEDDQTNSGDQTHYQTASQTQIGTPRIQGRKPVGQLFPNTSSPEKIIFGRYDSRSQNAGSGYSPNNGLINNAYDEPISPGTRRITNGMVNPDNEVNQFYQNINGGNQANSSADVDTPRMRGEQSDQFQIMKQQLVDEAGHNLRELASLLQQIWKTKNDAMKILVQYTKSINNAMQKEGQRDLQFFGRLEELQSEASEIHSDLKNKENRIYQLEQQKTEMDRSYKELSESPQFHQPNDFNDFLNKSQNACHEAQQMRQSIVKTEAFLHHRNLEFTQLKQEIIPKGQTLEDIQKTQRQLESNFELVNPYLEGYPTIIHQTIHTLTEMSGDSTTERDKVRKQISELNRINSMHKTFANYFKNLYTMSFNNSWQTKMNSASHLNQELSQIKNTLSQQESKIREVKQNQDIVDSIRKDLAERQIPRSIKSRQEEINSLKKRVNGFRQKFKETMHSHGQQDLEMSTDSDIQGLLEVIQRGITNAEREIKEVQDHLIQKFQMYGDQGVPARNDEQIRLIRDLKQFKVNLKDIDNRMEKLNPPLYELKTKYVEYGIHESANLANIDFQHMIERVNNTEQALEKNINCAKQMDGNASDDNEEYLIKNLKREIPENMKQLKSIKKDIKNIEDVIKQIQKKKDVKKIKTVQQKIKETEQKIAELEVKAKNNKVEINQMYAIRKLCKRDLELYEIDANLKVLEKYFQIKNLLIHKENLQIKEKIQCIHNGHMQDKDGSKKQNLMALLPQISKFQGNVDQLVIEVLKLMDQRQKLYVEFNSQVPNEVKEDRLKRSRTQNDSQTTNIQIEIQSFKMDADSVNEKPNDTYYMIDVNCKFRKNIKDLDSKVQVIYQKQMEVTDMYANLQEQIASIGATKFYKPQKGDLTDECFAQFINSAALDLNVKRLQHERYQFGTKQIIVKLVNGSLLVRVGGGFMKAEQFIQQYGPLELKKLRQMRDASDNKSAYSDTGSKSPNNPRSVGSNPDMKAGIGEIRQWMKQELKDNPKIKPADLKRQRVKSAKKGMFLNSDGSSEINPQQEHQLAKFDIGSIERDKQITDFSPRKSRMRPCQSENQLQQMNRQKSQDVTGTVQMPSFRNEGNIQHFDSGNIYINQDLSPVAGYDTKMDHQNYDIKLDKDNYDIKLDNQNFYPDKSLNKKRLQNNFSENQLNRKAARRYGNEDMGATPEKLNDGGMHLNKKFINSKPGSNQLENLTERSNSYSATGRSVKSKSQTRNLDHYQVMLLENTSSTVSKNSRNKPIQRNVPQNAPMPPNNPSSNQKKLKERKKSTEIKVSRKSSSKVRNKTPRADLTQALDKLKRNQNNQAFSGDKTAKSPGKSSRGKLNRN